MNEQDDIFYNGDYMLKTIPLEEIYRTTKIEKSRKCNTCSEYNKPEKDMCIPVGIIINPDITYCSWWKGNNYENKTNTKSMW